MLYLSVGEFLIHQENDGAVSPVAGVLNYTVRMLSSISKSARAAWNADSARSHNETGSAFVCFKPAPRCAWSGARHMGITLALAGLDNITETHIPPDRRSRSFIPAHSASWLPTPSMPLSGSWTVQRRLRFAELMNAGSAL